MHILCTVMTSNNYDYLIHLWIRIIVVWLELLTADVIVATVLGLIPASSDILRGGR
jgi:hypothetical protein